jgi:hypothetical protein
VFVERQAEPNIGFTAPFAISHNHLSCKDRKRAMDILFADTYKSIGPFEWRDVPDFAVVTGPNGCGKSQLLELLSTQIERGIASGFSADKGEILHLKADWQRLSNIGPLDLGQLQKQAKELWRRFESFRSASGSLQTWQLQLFEDIAQRIGKDRRAITYEDFFANLPSRGFSPPKQIFNQTVGEIFLRYHIQKIERLAQGWSVDEIQKEYGPPPWILLKEILRGTSLPFDFSDPSTTARIHSG